MCWLRHLMLGNRVLTRREALAGGMPLYKYAANRFLSLLCNVVTGENLGEWHSGLRGRLFSGAA